MSFSTEIAKLVTNQLSRFVTLNRHELAGQVANLDFWLGEVRHALEVLDGYGQRFQKLKSGQAKYVSEHNTIQYHLDDPSCTYDKTWTPQRVPDTELKVARRSMTEAAYRFLVRCLNDGLIPESGVRDACASLGIGVDASDLRPQHKSTE
jgi:hypothetical protein